MSVRLAGEGDAARLARLHATQIGDGFLASLGPAFLERLYRRIAWSPDAFAYVDTDAGAESEAASVVGFAAAALDVGALYKSFLIHDGLRSSLVVAPALIRSWRRVIETLRYPARAGDGTDAGELPRAEILAVAVDDAASGRGVGARVVDAATAELARRGVTAVKVVCGSDNAAALRLYEKCGFHRNRRIEVHAGTSSEVLVWSSS